MKVFNPATGEVIREVTTDGKKEIAIKYEKLCGGQKNWGSLTVKSRVVCIEKLARLFEQNIDSLALILTSEMGKPLAESKGEIQGAIKKMQFFIEKSEEILEDKTIQQDGNTLEKISYDPLGVVANISAWNYPYLVGVNIFVPALITGNAVLYKPSEFATLTGLEIKRLVIEAGIPSDVFEVVIGGGEAGQELLDLPLDGYFFTGSYKTGEHIAKSVASKLVPVGLELGGKDALYVCDEIDDVRQVAVSAIEGAFYNNGQSCCAVERIYVHENIYDEFLEFFSLEVKKLKAGDPLEAGFSQGAITRTSHLEFLEDQVRDALELGADLISGGSQISGKGSFFAPTAFSNVNHQMKIMKEETFGPIIGVMKVKDDIEAIRLINDTDYGLTASVFSNNKERSINILKEVNTGTCYINCCDRVSGFLPWSGRGHSGLGSTLSHLGLYAFCNPKGWHIRD